MKNCLRILVFLGLCSWVWAAAGAAPPANSEVNAAVQAIQQAPDPSAAVAAYANGMAVDRADPRLNVAYVARMVDLGLPELAYHQAETLTTMQSNNGLAWGVVAYVDARRGQMPEAISAINLAGQLAPDHPFVERTAGEILAWYDTRADKSKLPANAKEGLNQVRNLLNQRPAFVSAYDTARKAYQSQTSAVEQPAGTAPSAAAPTPAEPAQTQPEPQSSSQVAPLGYAQGYAPGYAQAPAPYYPAYYPGTYDYYYDWGPGWVQPAPWWWWQPTGFFAGFGFVPFGGIVVFDDHNDFDHHGHHHHDGDHHHDGNAPHHGGQSFHGQNQAVWHQDGTGTGSRTGFFGRPAQPNATLAQWNRDSFQRTPGTAPGRGVGTANFANRGATTSPPGASVSRGTAWPGGAAVRQGTVTSRGAVGPATSPMAGSRSSIAGSTTRWPSSVSPALRQSPSTSRGSVSPSMQAPVNPGSRFGSSPAVRSWSGSSSRSFTTAPGSFGGGPSFHGSPGLSGSRMGGPIGGGGSPGGAFRGGGFGGGASGAGGFHGGGFGGRGGGGGGGGGGGHR